MNRGRRRGFSYGGLANLKESVRRRLCDLTAVPYVPDPKVEVSRLVPIKYPEIDIPSALTRPSNSSTVTTSDKKCKETEFHRQVFETQAIVEYAFQRGRDGLYMASSKDVTSSARIGSKFSTSSETEHASAAKLLLKRKEVEFWDSGILGLCSAPDEWFPAGITTRRKRKALDVEQSSTGAKRVRFEESTELTGSDLNNFPDSVLLTLEDAVKDDTTSTQLLDTADDTLDPESEVKNPAEEGEDSEDERWNGDPPDPEDEDGDDYMETYFDNGENDIDDFNLQMNGDMDGDDLDGIYD